jgi:hypothetical protein
MKDTSHHTESVKDQVSPALARYRLTTPSPIDSDVVVEPASTHPRARAMTGEGYFDVDREIDEHASPDGGDHVVIDLFQPHDNDLLTRFGTAHWLWHDGKVRTNAEGVREYLFAGSDPDAWETAPDHYEAQDEGFVTWRVVTMRIADLKSVLIPFVERLRDGTNPPTCTRETVFLPVVESESSVTGQSGAVIRAEFKWRDTAALGFLEINGEIVASVDATGLFEAEAWT